MERTNDLRKLIVGKLATIESLKGVYYQLASEQALYPHVVFSLDSADLSDTAFARHDYSLEIHVWDKQIASEQAENITDAIIDLFRVRNLPQNTILPTFYLESRGSVLDEDKMIKHRYIRFEVQTYDR